MAVFSYIFSRNKLSLGKLCRGGEISCGLYTIVALTSEEKSFRSHIEVTKELADRKKQVIILKKW